MLVPLYLLIRDDLHLQGVKQATFLVTLYGLVYATGSIFAGVLADRTNRKMLLGIGLVGNALAILGMGLTRQYEVLVLLAVMGGLFGTLFHPAANALIPAHYPRSPGMVIGLLGVGAGIGFFVGPQFAGSRAEHGGWQWAGMADWQRPLIELGIVGLIGGIVYLLIAKDVPHVRSVESLHTHRRLTWLMRRKVILVAVILSCRDFAGIASLSLASIYFQKALGMGARQAGFILGSTMLIAIIINPLMVYLSPGRKRLPALVIVLLAGAVIAAFVPHTPAKFVLPILCLFQAMHLGSYAVSDAALLERVPAALRGRVVGLFLTIAGSVAATGPWVMGAWTDALGPRAFIQAAYAAPFATLGALLAISSLSTLVLRTLSVPEHHPVDPISEINPSTMEVIG